MNLTLTQRRAIVERFWAGESLMAITHGRNCYFDKHGDAAMLEDIEQVLRDFMLGKFKLKEKKR